MTRGPEVDDGRHEAPAASLVGTWVHGRYEVVSELGWGSLGHVYEAVDHLRREAPGAPPERVALKVIRRDRLSPRSVEFLKREFRALTRLSHPNVARVHDLDVVPGGGELFFSLELLRGRTIVDAARGWQDGLGLFAQALRALMHVHARGLIHMDLKPQNILVLGEDERRRVKLLDFHLVHAAGDADLRTMRGTIAYMAPEVIRGEAVGPTADLYSLGAVWYHALTGAPPFAGLAPMEVLRAHTRDAPAPLSERGADVPPALEAIVRRLLEKEPRERFPSAAEALRALEVSLGAQPQVDLPGEGAGPPSALGPAELVAREAEVEAIVALARRRPASAPWVALVRGEPGIGRSRLLAEAKVALQLEGTPALLARGGGDAPYGPLRGVLAELLRRAGRQDELARLAPDGLAVDPDRLAGGALQPAPDAQLPEAVRRTAAVVSLLSDLAREAPFALLLDDADKADPSTREVVRALVAGPPLPMTLVLAQTDDGTARDRGPDAIVAGGPALVTLDLPRLGRGATGALVASLLGRAAPERLVERVWSVTGGNPRFVDETVRSLAEAELLGPAGGAVPEDAAAGVLDDATLRALVLRRVGRLAEEPLLLLGACACSPRPRGLPFLAAAAALGLSAAQAALRELERRGLVGRAVAPPGTPALLWPLQVEHEPLRAATLEALGPERRRRIHDQAARLLETRHPVTQETAGIEGRPEGGTGAARGGAPVDRSEELLAHLEGAGRTAEAQRRAIEAAEGAWSRRELRRARDLTARALALAAGAETSEVELERLLVRHAEALAATGARDEARARLAPLLRPDPEAGGDGAAGLPRSAEAATLAARLAKDAGELREALRLASAAVAAAEGANARGSPGAQLQRGRALGERAAVRLWQGDYALARQDGEAALAALDRAQAGPSDGAPVLDTLFHATRFLGLDQQATVYLRRALRAAQPVRPRPPTEPARAAPRAGPAAEAQRQAEAAQGEDDPWIHPERIDAEGAALLGDASGAHVPRTVVEAAIERTGRAGDLSAHYRRRVELLLAAGDAEGAAWALVNAGHLEHSAARHADALERYTRARALFGATRCATGSAVVALAAARALADLGAADEAAAEAGLAATGGEETGSRWIVAQAHAVEAEAARARGDGAGARAALERALALALALGNVPLRAELVLRQAELDLEVAEERGAAPAEAARALGVYEKIPAGARTVSDDLRASLLHASLGRLGATSPPTEEDARRLALAEGRAARALEVAEARQLPELAWRAAAARSRVRRARGDAEGELSDLVRALELLRGVAASLPESRRASYLAHPERVSVRARFTRLRG